MEKIKLYTEKQLLHVIKRSLEAECPADMNNILNDITPIELPSDEEIDKQLPINDINAHDYYFGYKDGFEEGVKWILEQIK